MNVLTGLATDLLVDEFEVAPAPKPKETEAQPEPEVGGEENREEGKTTYFSLVLFVLFKPVTSTVSETI